MPETPVPDGHQRVRKRTDKQSLVALALLAVPSIAQDDEALKHGNRYRVYLNADGRVVVEKRR